MVIAVFVRLQQKSGESHSTASVLLITDLVESVQGKGHPRYHYEIGVGGYAAWRGMVKLALVTESPNRTNIRYAVNKIKHLLHWLKRYVNYTQH